MLTGSNPVLRTGTEVTKKSGLDSCAPIVQTPVRYLMLIDYDMTVKYKQITAYDIRGNHYSVADYDIIVNLLGNS